MSETHWICLHWLSNLEIWPSFDVSLYFLTSTSENIYFWCYLMFLDIGISWTSTPTNSFDRPIFLSIVIHRLPAVGVLCRSQWSPEPCFSRIPTLKFWVVLRFQVQMCSNPSDPGTLIPVPERKTCGWCCYVDNYNILQNWKKLRIAQFNQ